MKRISLVVLVASFAVVGCTTTADVCMEASQHVAACTGQEANIPGGICDAQAAALAEQTLTTSCDAIQADGKADGLSSPLGLAACIAFGVPLFVSGAEEGDLCCFSYNCKGGVKGELTCRKFKCQQPSVEGGPCDRNGHCVKGLACVFDKCAPPLAEGETCEDPGDCASGLTCGIDDTCTAPGSTGDTCTANHHCASVCIAGSCAPRSAKGDACDSGDDFDCTLGLTCIDRICSERPASGEACDRSSPFQCGMDETCWDGKCVARHAAGEPCERMFDCQTGLFCMDGVCGDF